MTNIFPPHPLFDDFAIPHVCGHRGHSVGGHENSAMALKLARDFGASMCEIDLQLTADEQFIAFHDEILDHTSSGHGRVGAYRLEQLKALTHRLRTDGTLSDEPLLSIADMLTLAHQLGLCLLIELKTSLNTPAQYAALIKLIEDADMMQRVMISAFDFKALQRLKSLHRSLPTLGIIHGNHVDPVAIAQQADLDVYHVDYPYFHPETAVRLHEAGIRTGHFIPRPDFFKAMGADGEAKLAALAAHIRSGHIDVFINDDVEWARAFVDQALS